MGGMDDRLRTDLAMAGVARVLSLGFAPPSAEVHALMAELGTAVGATLGAEPLRSALDVLVAALPMGPEGITDLAAEHHRLFAGTVACPPHETSYSADPFQQARQMSDIAGFYAAFGSEPSGPVHDRVDHLGCELEFLAFLVAERVRAQVAGRDDDAEVCAAAEVAFLRDHLGRWLGPFCLELERATAHPVCAALGRLGQRFAVEELERRDLRADPVLARRIRTVVEGDSFECGAEAAGPAAALQGVLGRGERARGGP